MVEQDDWLSKLFPDEIVDISSFVKYSSSLREALTTHICFLLSKGLTIVLDFPVNTRTQRAWFRELIEWTNVAHELHYIDAIDEVCKRQLRERSENLAEGSPFTSNAEFEAITKYFQAPSDDENSNVIRHQRT